MKGSKKNSGIGHFEPSGSFSAKFKYLFNEINCNYKLDIFLSDLVQTRMCGGIPVRQARGIKFRAHRHGSGFVCSPYPIYFRFLSAIFIAIHSTRISFHFAKK